MAANDKMSNLKQAFGASLLTHTPLAPYTYIKIGGPAQFLLVVTTTADFVKALQLAAQDNIPVTILGAGSNIVVSDAGIDGVVIINRTNQITSLPGSRLEVASGTLVNQLVNYTVNAGLQGLEEFLGLPGTVGGAVYNNSHHLTHLIGDTVVSGQIWDRQTQKEITYQPQDFAFTYDMSSLQTSHNPVLSVVFQLQPGEPETLRRLAHAALKRRRDTQPLEYPSSGCMFKNLDPKTAHKHDLPPGVTAAGWLVDHAGCKGMREGGAMVSDKHANFIVNTGGATATDLKVLSNRVRRRVKDRFGVSLTREIFFLGKHPGLET